MKKLLFTALGLALVLGFATSVQAAECADAAPALSTEPASLETAPAASTPDIGTEVPALFQEPTEMFDLEICRWWACELTPTGCGCAGFYCNGRFICGYRIKVK